MKYIEKLIMKFLNWRFSYKERTLTQYIKEGRRAVKEYNLQLCYNEVFYTSDALMKFENHIGGRLDDETQLKCCYHNFYNSFEDFKQYKRTKYYNTWLADLHKQDFVNKLKYSIDVYGLKLEHLRFSPEEVVKW